MKTKFLAWLFFITCAIAVSSTSAAALKNMDFDLSKNFAREEVHGVNGTTTGLYGKGYEGKHEILFHSRMGHKGKGSYGGANVVHHPRPTRERAASSLARPPSSFVSATIAYVGFSLLPVFNF